LCVIEASNKKRRLLEMSHKSEFGTVECYKLTNVNGCEVEIINYGAYVRSFKVPDKDNRGLVDIVLGYDTFAGAWIGPGLD